MNETTLKSGHKIETNDDVLRLADVEPAAVASLLTNYGLVLKTVSVHVSSMIKGFYLL